MRITANEKPQILVSKISDTTKKLTDTHLLQYISASFKNALDKLFCGFTHVMWHFHGYFHRKFY